MKELLADSLLDFVEYCELERGLSPKTAQKYHYRLNRFLDWLKRQKGAEVSVYLSDITEESIKDFRLHLNRYESELTKKSLAASTQQHYLVALRAFLKYLKRQKSYKQVSPDDILLPKASGRKVTFLNAEELSLLFQQPDVRDVLGLRDRAMLELLFSTGLRVQELVNLDTEQIPKSSNEFTVLGKGSRYRVVFLSDQARSWIQLYLERRLDTWKPLFLNNSGLRQSLNPTIKAKNLTKRSKGSRSDENDPGGVMDHEGERFRLTVRSVQRMIKKYARTAGLTTDVTPHVMRHSFATDLLSAGADLRSVQELLGHKNVATTQIYTHVTNQQLRKVYEQFHSTIKENSD